MLEGVQMKIMVVGVGALGSLFGGSLSSAGHDVTLLIRNQAHRDAIRSEGLTLYLDDRVVKASPYVVNAESASEAGIADLILVFTKTGSTRAALEAARPVIGPQTRLVSLQNGLGNADVLADFVPIERVIYGTTIAPADLTEPGAVTSHGKRLSQMRAAGNDVVTAGMVDQLAEMLNGAGLEAAVTPDVDAVIWGKVAFNCAMNSLCALLHLTPGPLLDSAELFSLVIDVTNEVADVAAACGVLVDRDSLRQTLDMVHRQHRDHRPSMLVDVMARRRTEIDALNGAVAALGQQHGVPTPRTQTLLALVHAYESKYLGHEGG